MEPCSLQPDLYLCLGQSPLKDMRYSLKLTRSDLIDFDLNLNNPLTSGRISLILTEIRFSQSEPSWAMLNTS